MREEEGCGKVRKDVERRLPCLEILGGRHGATRSEASFSICPLVGEIGVSVVGGLRNGGTPKRGTSL